MSSLYDFANIKKFFSPILVEKRLNRSTMMIVIFVIIQIQRDIYLVVKKKEKHSSI